MPSPFPGMDPYLEDPVVWPGFHSRMIDSICDILNEELPARYAADINERVYVETRDRVIMPDVTVLERSDQTLAASKLAISADPSVILKETTSEMREAFVEVFALDPEEQVIATIELLSY